MFISQCSNKATQEAGTAQQTPLNAYDAGSQLDHRDATLRIKGSQLDHREATPL
ncbi:Hypothetical predicted protein, partial [Pelobates cultripes]